LTNKACDTLNIPRLEDALKEFSNTLPELETAALEVDKMAAALQKMDSSSLNYVDQEGTENHEREMNDVYQQALKAHKEMLELGYNVESKYAGSVFEPAARFLEIAINASKSKSEQKLKTIKLRMEREKLDADLKKTDEEVIDAVDVSSVLLDRNDLLKDLAGRLRDSKILRK
jgi:hypothetical protein